MILHHHLVDNSTLERLIHIKIFILHINFLTHNMNIKKTKR
jgi:hypothetical protein